MQKGTSHERELGIEFEREDLTGALANIVHGSTIVATGGTLSSVKESIQMGKHKDSIRET